MNKERQRKLAARARRMESLHPTSTIAIQTNEETESVNEIVKVKKIKKDVEPTKVKKTEKKQKEIATKKSKIKSGSIQKVKESKDVSKKKRHNSKGRN
jgi:hypothetical protein